MPWYDGLKGSRSVMTATGAGFTTTRESDDDGSHASGGSAPGTHCADTVRMRNRPYTGVRPNDASHVT